MPPPYWNPLTAKEKNPVPSLYAIPAQKRLNEPSQRIIKLREQILNFRDLVTVNKLEEAMKVLKVILSSDLNLIDQSHVINKDVQVSHCGGYTLFDQSQYIIRDLRTFAEQSKNHQFALAIEKQLLETEKRFFSPTDMRVAATLLSIGNIYYSMKDLGQALKYYRQSWDIQKLYITEQEAMRNMGDRFIKCLNDAGEVREADRLKTLFENRYKRNTTRSRVTDVTSLHLSPQNKLTEAIKQYKEYSKIRPYGYEASETLELLVGLANALKKYDLVCTYGPQLVDLHIRLGKQDDWELKKDRELLVDANLALGNIQEARKWVDILRSKIDSDLTLHELIKFANLEIKVKRNKNAEKYLDLAEASLKDSFEYLPPMRQIELTWKLMDRQDRIAKIKKRIAPLDKNLPRLNPYTGTYMSNDERYKDAAKKADAYLEQQKEKLRKNYCSGTTDHFYNEMQTFLQMQGQGNKINLQLKILDLAEVMFKARRIKDGKNIAFVVGFHPSYDSDPLKLSLGELKIAELLMQLDLEKNQYGLFEYESFSDHAQGFCGEIRDPALSSLQTEIRYRLQRLGTYRRMSLYQKPFAGMSWPAVDAPSGYELGRDMIAAKSLYQHFDFNTDEESEKLYKSYSALPDCPAILKPGQNLKAAKTAPFNAHPLTIKVENQKLPPGNYVLKTASLSSLTIQPAGTVRLFFTEQSVVDGPVFVARKSARINSETGNANFELWYDGEGTIKIEEGCVFGGTIYAPNARIEIGKDVHIKGTVAAKDIWIGGKYYR